MQEIIYYRQTTRVIMTGAIVIKDIELKNVNEETVTVHGF